MREEDFGPIADGEVYEAISCGEVIEVYPDAEPYPGALIFGRTKLDRPIHIVCAYDSSEDRAVIITIYQPDPKRWVDYRTRLE